MNQDFIQPRIIYKINFNTKYRNFELFEFFLNENYNIAAVSGHEIESTTVTAEPDDIWCLEAYFFDKPDPVELQSSLSDFSKSNGLDEANDLALQIIEDKDWVAEYQKQLKPIEVGRFCLGSKRCLSDYPLGSKIPIYLEASRAFGTGEHQTTSGCIEAMEFVAENLSYDKLKKILDIGTGSGVLSFAAEKLWPTAKIIGYDIDPVSVDIALINKDANQSDANFYVNTSEEKSLITEDKYNLIIANILAAPIISLAPTIKDLCDNNSYVILSGFLRNQLQGVASAYIKQGFSSWKIFVKDDWIIIILKLISSNPYS